MDINFSLPEEDLAYIYSTLGHRLEAFKGRILVTGATGFFGRWVVETLAWMRSAKGVPIEIDVLVREGGAYAAQAPSGVCGAVQIVEGNLGEKLPLRHKYSYIVHLASPLIRPQDPNSFHAHLAIATSAMQQVIEWAGRTGPDCNVLFTSSGAVYGNFLGSSGGTRPYEETFTGQQEFLSEKLVYSQTKRYLELLLLSAGIRFGFGVKIARCFSFVGPYLPLDSNYAVGNFLRNALNGERIVIQGDGRVRRSYLYAADMVIALMAILLAGRNGAAYNVGGNQAYSLLEVALLVAAQAPGCNVDVLNRQVSTGAGADYVPDLQQFHRDFSDLPSLTISQAIAKTFRWYQGLGTPTSSLQAN